VDATVTQISEVVVAELRAAGYMESTIGQYAKTIRALAQYVGERGRVYDPGLGADFASRTVSPRTGRFSSGRSVGSTTVGSLSCSTRRCEIPPAAGRSAGFPAGAGF
jgi:hypothetical protein